MTIRGIIFDFGGVFSPQHESLDGFSTAAERLGKTRQELYDLLYSGEEWRLARTGKLRAEEYWRQMMERLGFNRDGDLNAFMADLFSGEALNRDVVRIAEALRRRYPMVLLSNALDDLERLLAEKYVIAHLFDAVVNSATAGVAKPEPQAYLLALRALGMQAHEALFIDDRPRNIDAAEALGIPSIRYTTPQALVRALLARGVLQEAELTELRDLTGEQATAEVKERETL